MVRAVGEREVAAEVDRARVLGGGDRARPTTRAAIAPERVDDDVAAHRPAVGGHAECALAIVTPQQPLDLDAGAQLDARLRDSRPPQRPLDDRPAHPQVDEVLVGRLLVGAQPEREILRLRAGAQQRGEHVGGELAEDAPPAREKRVRLEEMGDPAAFDAERAVRRVVGLDVVTLDDDRHVPRSCDAERRGEPRDTAAGDHEPHETHAIGVVGWPLRWSRHVTERADV